MNGTRNEPGVVLAPEEEASADRRSRLRQVLGNLEHISGILDSMELTLAVALLDHAMAEVGRTIDT
jgi:hypothetical protein